MFGIEARLILVTLGENFDGIAPPPIWVAYAIIERVQEMEDKYNGKYDEVKLQSVLFFKDREDGFHYCVVFQKGTPCTCCEPSNIRVCLEDFYQYKPDQTPDEVLDWYNKAMKKKEEGYFLEELK